MNYLFYTNSDQQQTTLHATHHGFKPMSFLTTISSFGYELIYQPHLVNFVTNSLPTLA